MTTIVLPGQEPDRFVEFSVNGTTRKMYGGSFYLAPQNSSLLTVNLMAEQPNLASDVYYPIRDFSIPGDMNSLRELFDQIIQSEKDVYVGCFGGKGRTGLFMAAFLKYLGDPDPITTTRSQYRPEAVETPQQSAYVLDFPSLEKKSAKIKI